MDASKIAEIDSLGEIFSETRSEAIFSKLVALMSDDIKAYVIYKLNGKHMSDVDDICSEIFIKLFTKSHTYYRKERGGYYNWSIGVSKQSVCDFLREKHNRRVTCYSNLGVDDSEFFESFVDRDDSIANDSYNKFVIREIMRIVHTLNDDIKECFVLVYVKGHTVNEVSTMLGVCDRIVRSRLTTGKRIIKQTIVRTIPDIML